VLPSRPSGLLGAPASNSLLCGATNKRGNLWAESPYFNTMVPLPYLQNSRGLVTRSNTDGAISSGQSAQRCRPLSPPSGPKKKKKNASAEKMRGARSVGQLVRCNSLASSPIELPASLPRRNAEAIKCDIRIPSTAAHVAECVRECVVPASLSSSRARLGWAGLPGTFSTRDQRRRKAQYCSGWTYMSCRASVGPVAPSYPSRVVARELKASGNTRPL